MNVNMTKRRRRRSRSTFSVFLSHSMRDAALVEQMRAELSAVGATVFVADEAVPPGDSLKERITEALVECDLVIVLWSKNSVSSEWVRNEIGMAMGHGKMLVPFVVDPEATIPSFLADTKFIRAYEGMSASIKRLQDRIQELSGTKQQAAAEREANAIAVIGACALVLALLSAREG